MSMIEEKLNNAAIIAAANYDNPFDEPAYDKNFYDGFKAGAEWMLSNLWHSVAEELPPIDGEYLILVKLQDPDYEYHIEIAPWRNGKYQGSLMMAVEFGQEEVTHWMPIPKLPER